MKFLDSHIITAVVTSILTVTGLVLGRRKNNSEVGKNDAEASQNRSQMFLNEIDYLTKDRDRYRDWFHQSEKVVKSLNDALDAMKHEYEEKIVALEDRCNKLEDKVAKLIAEKH